MSIAIQGAALVSLVWSCAVFLVQTIGITNILRSHSPTRPKPTSPLLKHDDVPHVTIIRPVKGLEAGLYECLASSFRLAYPKSKLTVYLCVATADDPAYPVLEQILADHPDFDAKIMVEEDDPVLHGTSGHVNNLGPNPKIRNMSRAYREAKGDIVWIVDCNIWVGTGSVGRMVDKLCGFLPDGGRTTPYKFVHQLPLVVDLDTAKQTAGEEQQTLLPKDGSATAAAAHAPTSILDYGGRLEEMFMTTSHAKFYAAINTVCIAPCIVGKSNMFRKSHLDRFTDPAQNPILSAASSSRGRGLDFFSSYICEDHLIGDLIWRSPLPGFLNHALVFGEVAVQPMAGMSVAAYAARRVRWLRVRKWTVPAATLVEPGIEPLLCSLHLSFALTTFAPVRDRLFSVPPTWAAMAAIWAGTLAAWMVLDRWFSGRLRRLESVEVDEHTPDFARGSSGSRHGGVGVGKRPFREWLAAWIGREVLALPVWTWAVLLGTTVDWRGRHFRVRMDMSVVEMGGDAALSGAAVDGGSNSGCSRPGSRNKDRVD
ncbi:glycosyltransferase [Staphylotrichum tortipilum]|uniref:Ceramide glucosyltransferase n=1 Tax=Staphylotrichum tortipilum TaxID=2831512 RepID=A0AAN6MI53_9PEZI|nr:glycosyltransferase [Staphylotrichum longicolle]